MYKTSFPCAQFYSQDREDITTHPSHRISAHHLRNLDDFIAVFFKITCAKNLTDCNRKHNRRRGGVDLISHRSNTWGK